MTESERIQLVCCVKIGEKLFCVSKYICFDVHESPFSQLQTVVLLDVGRKTRIYESKDIEENKILEKWAHLFVCRESLVKIVDAFVLSSYII